ncbi:MAG: hypothetical protein PHR19_02440 [Bacteroidales bacterium]|nr:hypothetical protein [Bacteroidales bacterium]
MKRPHKHRDLIIAWANDTSLKFEYLHNGNWVNVCGCPAFNIMYEYRIKPEVIRYRVALFQSIENKYLLFTQETVNEHTIRQDKDFIKWLTDWIEVEVDAK